MNFREHLLLLGASQEMINYAGDKTMQEFIDTCDVTFYLLWLYRYSQPNDESTFRNLILAQGHLINSIRHLFKSQESLNSIQAALAYGDNKISKQQLGMICLNANYKEDVLLCAKKGNYTQNINNTPDKEGCDILRYYLCWRNLS